MRAAAVSLLLLASMGCRPDDEDTSVVTIPDPPTLTTTACSPPAPDDFETEQLQYPGEEFTFDDQGRLITVVDWADAAWAANRDLDWTWIAPFPTDEAAGVDILLDGDIVVCDEGNGSVQRVSPQGATSPLSGAVSSPNSIAVRDTGFVYVTAYDTILRLDPDTGNATEIAAVPGQDLDGLVFSPDFRRLWFNADETGDIFYTELTSTGEPIETVLVATLKATNEAQLDGMAMDQCGDLYVSRTDGRISRVRADGEVEGAWLRIKDGAYTSALHFGSGVGGWKRDHLYILDRTGWLHDVPVGVDGALEPHLAHLE